MPSIIQVEALQSNDCPSCHTSSVKVYQEWVCPKPSCDSFWMLSDNTNLPQNARFEEAFLQQRIEHTSNVPAESIIPAPLDLTKDKRTIYSRAFWQGWRCEECGSCHSRENFTGLTCTCGNDSTPEHRILTAKEASARLKPDGTILQLKSKRKTNSTVLKATSFQKGLWTVNKYEFLPSNFVLHFSANEILNALPGNADDIFKALQTCKGMKLKRRFLGNNNSPTSVSAELTAQFSENFGLPYKYVVAQDSTKLSEAPQPVLRGLRQLQWAGSVAEIEKEFNEILAVAYLDLCKMSPHDDGEKDVGPTIATLSLGCKAHMTFETKDDYRMPPFSKRTEIYNTEELVVPGSVLYKQRQEMKERMDQNPSLTPTAQGVWFKRMQGDQTVLDDPPDKHKLLCSPLKHEDVVVMGDSEMHTS